VATRFGEGLRLYEGRIFQIARTSLPGSAVSAEALAFSEIPTDEGIIAENSTHPERESDARYGVHIRLTADFAASRPPPGWTPRPERNGGRRLIVLAET